MATLLNEQPWFSQKVGLYARRNGKYDRPITGDLIDIRLEDFIPDTVLRHKIVPSLIAKLPNIAALNQINLYILVVAGVVENVRVPQAKALELLKTGQYLELPADPKSELWAYSKSPWWEYAMVIDKYGQYIKAPKRPRHGEPSADEIDERLDEFEENRGILEVTSPSRLEQYAHTESYVEKLDRCFYG